MGTDALAAAVVEPAVAIGAHALALLLALVGAHARVHIDHSAVDRLGPLAGQAGVVVAGATLQTLLVSGTYGNAYGGPLVNILCGDGVKQFGQTLNIAYLRARRQRTERILVLGAHVQAAAALRIQLT